MKRERSLGFTSLGPLLPLLTFLLVNLLIIFSFRLGFFVSYYHRIVETEDLYKIFMLGLRMDVLIISYILFIPTVLLFLLPSKVTSLKYFNNFLIMFFTVFTALFFFMEFSTIGFLREYDNRPDNIFIEYLIYPKEILSTLWKANKIELIMIIPLMILVFKMSHKLYSQVVTQYKRIFYGYQILFFPIVGFLLFIGSRSSFSHRPANISTAYFSSNRLSNELTLNSTYTLLYALYRLKHEKNPAEIYGHMEEKEVMARVQKYNSIEPHYYLDQQKIPFLHSQKVGVQRKKPLNVVVIIEESLGAEYVGVLGGLPLTPYFDQLAKEGMLFTNLYATGTRTVRGLEAILTGFLPTPGTSVVKLSQSKKDFFTAGALFKQHGYSTHFIYGGESNFDEMKSFFFSNGFDKVFDQLNFKNPEHLSSWGVSDEDLMKEAHSIIKDIPADQPFFSVILTTSNHSPFDFPEGKIEYYEQPKETTHNAMKYADYALGKFFQLAKTAPYYDKTIFLVLADHNTRVYGDSFIPVEKFHIPALIIAPGLAPTKNNLLASQIDLMPSLLHLSGLETIHPMVGHNLFTAPENFEGRSIMQYGNHFGFRVGNKLVVLKPDTEPSQFIYHDQDKKLEEVLVEEELVKDALAHALLPWILYKQKKYRTSDTKTLNYISSSK